MRYTQRMVDEITAVLFDARRQSCHGLVLNRFVAFSGFKQLLNAFQLACQNLFNIVQTDQQPSKVSGAAAAAAANASGPSQDILPGMLSAGNVCPNPQGMRHTH